jgi:hypothetical protein
MFPRSGASRSVESRTVPYVCAASVPQLPLNFMIENDSINDRSTWSHAGVMQHPYVIPLGRDI